MSLSKLDQAQIIQTVFDEASGSLKITGSSIPGSMTVDQLDGSKLHVTVDASVLPTGAATETKQDAGNTSVASIDTKTPALVAGRVPVDGSGVTQPVSAASLPLPTGAATEAKQDTANTSLASIDTKLTSPLAVTGPITDAQLRATAVPVSAASLPLPTGAATQATLAALSGKTAAGLVPEAYDYQDISYVVSGPGAGEIGTIVYKSGGPTGTIVAQVFLAYDGSNRLISVEKA